MNTVALSDDGGLALSGGDEGDLKLWEVATGRLVRNFQRLSSAVKSVAFSHDGRLALSGGTDRTVRMWEVASGRELRSFKGHSGEVWAVAFSPDNQNVLSGSYDKTLKLWDAASGQLVRTLKGHHGPVKSLAISANGKYVLSGSSTDCLEEDCYAYDWRQFRAELKLWDLSTGRLVRTLRGHTNSVVSVAFSPGSQQALSGSNDNTIKLWDVTRGRLLRTFGRTIGNEVSHCCSVAFSSDGRRALASTSDGKLMYWDVASGWTSHTFATQAHARVTFSADGRYALFLGSTLDLWEADSGRRSQFFLIDPDQFMSVALSPDRRFAISGRWNGSVQIWSLETGHVRSLGHDSKWTWSVAFSPDGGYALAGCGDTSLRLWDITTGQVVLAFEDYFHGFAVAFSPDGCYVISNGGKPTSHIEIWDAKTGEVVRDFEGLTDGLDAVAVSPDSRYALTADNYAGLRLWDMATGDELKRLIPRSHYDIPDDIVQWVAFSPDGRHAVSSGDGGTGLWEVATGNEIWRRTDCGSFAEFTRDGRYVVTKSRAAIRLLEVATGQEARTISDARGGRTSLAISADGRLALMGSWDGTLKLMDIQDGRELCSLFSFGEDGWVVLSPDGRFDTNVLDGNEALHWVMPDDPFRPLPLEIFMKDYYEPRLLARLLAGEKLPPLRALQDLNRAQPAVKIAKVEREAGGDTVSVTVEVGRGHLEVGEGKDRKAMDTGVYDLELFRDGQLVGSEPSSPPRGATPAAEIKTDAAGHATKVFPGIRLPRKTDVHEVEFSAYAFNVDRVKSETSRYRYTLPNDLTPVKGRAYVVSMGVNSNENEVLKLDWAVADARGMQTAVVEGLEKTGAYDEVVPILLTSENGSEPTARKAVLKSILALLAGHQLPPEERDALIRSIPEIDRLRKATPEDLLLISVSSHGYLGEKGAFYLFPFDMGKGEGRTIDERTRGHAISTDDLAEWLHDVDAGDMAMVVDACHSAATVAGEGFKPGPMGSRGFGQLAFDKGMRVLAASQSDAVAVESERLKQGLLTYALVRDGIEAKQADFKPKDGVIRLGEWLTYGVERVPTLYEELRENKVQTFGRGNGVRAAIPAEGLGRVPEQKPALFDFGKKKADVTLTNTERSNEVRETPSP